MRKHYHRTGQIGNVFVGLSIFGGSYTPASQRYCVCVIRPENANTFFLSRADALRAIRIIRRHPINKGV